MARTVTVPILSQMLSAELARAGMIYYTILMLTRRSKARYVPATLFPAHELSKSRGARAPVDTVVESLQQFWARSQTSARTLRAHARVLRCVSPTLREGSSRVTRC